MGDLRNQLNKAGFLNKKDMKRLKHQDRIKHKEQGPEARERELAESREKFKQHKAGKQQDDRTREEEQNRQQKQREKLNHLRELVKSKAIKRAGRGKKFHFETRTGWLPCLEIGDEVARRLEAGSLAIVDLPWKKVETFALLPADAAKELKSHDQHCIRYPR